MNKVDPPILKPPIRGQKPDLWTNFWAMKNPIQAKNAIKEVSITHRNKFVHK